MVVGTFLSSTWRFLVDASKFCVSIAAGGLVLFAWYWGVNIQDVVYGFPFFKRIVRIRWPSDLTSKLFQDLVIVDWIELKLFYFSQQYQDHLCVIYDV
jgi:hypothetical protein